MTYDIGKHSAAFFRRLMLFQRKKVKKMHIFSKRLAYMVLMTSYLVTIETDFRQTLPKFVQGMCIQPLKVS